MDEPVGDRIEYLDNLRCLSLFAVIVLHVAAQKWNSIDVNSYEWHVLNAYDSLARWCVPVFVMISGALFLDKEIPLRRIYTKYICRLMISYVAWSLFYALMFYDAKQDFLLTVITGNYHMWYIPMMIGLYMCIAILKPIIVNMKSLKNFMILGIVFGFIIPEIITIGNDFGEVYLVDVMDAVGIYVRNMHMSIVMGFGIYFILGHLLNRLTLEFKWRMIIYLLGVGGSVFTTVMTAIVSSRTHQAVQNYYGYFCVNVLLEAVAVFTLFKHMKSLSYVKRIGNLFSGWSFGAYMIHVAVIEKLNTRFMLNTLSFNPLVSVLFISILTFVVSLLISGLLNQIPFVNKYVV